MTTLAEIEAAASMLPQDQKRKLFEWLAQQMRAKGSPAVPHSVLDIPPVSVGGIIRLPGEDDILGEMLEDRR